MAAYVGISYESNIVLRSLVMYRSTIFTSLVSNMNHLFALRKKVSMAASLDHFQMQPLLQAYSSQENNVSKQNRFTPSTEGRSADVQIRLQMIASGSELYEERCQWKEDSMLSFTSPKLQRCFG